MKTTKIFFLSSCLAVGWLLPHSLSAHAIIPTNLPLVALGPDGRFQVVNSSSETNCTTRVTVTGGQGIVAVRPLDTGGAGIVVNPDGSVSYSTPPVTAINFAVSPLQVGSTQLLVTWQITVSSPNCQGSGTTLINVIVNAPAAQTTSASNNIQSSGDPVSMATGELHTQDQTTTDLQLGGPLPADQAVVTHFGGRAIRFRRQDGLWALNSLEKVDHQLLQSGGGYRFLDVSLELTYSFDASGRLTRIEDRNGNALTVAPSPTGPGPQLVSDGLGRSLAFTYSSGKLTRVQDQTGRSVEFRYTGDDLTTFIDSRSGQTVYTYTSSGGRQGLMTSATLPGGSRPFTQQFDSRGRVAQQTDGLGRLTRFDYDLSPNGSGSAMTDPLGRVTRYVHPAFQNLSGITDAAGNADSLRYDGGNRLSSYTNRLNERFDFTYHEPSGYLSELHDPLSRRRRVEYQQQQQEGFRFYVPSRVLFADDADTRLEHDAKGNVTRLTDRGGAESRMSRNGRGQLLTLTVPTGAVINDAYNEDGTLARRTLPLGIDQFFLYDRLKRLAGVRHADNTTQAVEYDAADNITKVTDELGRSTFRTWDGNQNLRSVRDPLGSETRLEYDANDRLTRVIDRTGQVSTLEYDAAGQLSAIRNAAGEVTRFRYDELGRATGVTDAVGQALEQGYDTESRVVSVTDGLGKVRRLTLDTFGRPVQHIMPGGQRIDFTYDALDRLTAVRDPLGRVSTREYTPRGDISALSHHGISAQFKRDALGNVTAITDPNGGSWSREYDTIGRPTAHVDPLGRRTTLAYDNRGRLSLITTPLGAMRSDFDAAGNVRRRVFSDGRSFDFTYDALDRLTAANGITLRYDVEGRIIESNGLAIRRDAIGRIAAVTLAVGKTIQYEYDGRGRPVKVIDWLGGVTSLTYDAANRPTSLVRPNSTASSFEYDLNDRLVKITEASAGQSLASAAIQRNAAGEIVSVDRQRPAELTPAAGSLSLAYDAAHQVSGFQYDGEGRLVADDARQYVWDAASRLTGYSGSDGAAEFTYDDLDQRISRTASGVREDYALNYAFGLPSVAVVRSGGQDVSYYVHLPSGMLLYSIDAASNSRTFYHFDELGHTALLTNDQGAVTDAYAVSPYGEEVRHEGASTQPFVFHGALGVMQESGTSLYYMRSRYFDGDGCAISNP